MTPVIAPYGSWKSELGFDDLISATTFITEVKCSGQAAYWLQSDPVNEGRTAIMRYLDGQICQLTDSSSNVRSRLHEYGGGAYDVADGWIIWVNDVSADVWVRTPQGQTYPLTNSDTTIRYGDFSLCPARRCALALAEDHSGDSIRTTIVAFNLDMQRSQPFTVVEGADFYAHPTMDEQGHIAWIEWDIPHMPWDNSRLYRAQIDGNMRCEKIMLVDGITSDDLDAISVQSPQWVDGSLIYTSDRDGYYQIYRHDEEGITPLSSTQTDLDHPIFLLGHYTVAASSDRILCAQSRDGLMDIVSIGYDQTCDVLAECSYVDSVAIGDGSLYAIADRCDEGRQIICFDTDGHSEVIFRCDMPIDPSLISRPINLTHEGSHGSIQAWYYPPHNPYYQAPEGQRPPLIVLAHGGPTFAASPALQIKHQWWTSRGYAVVDVNYSGSTGFGRAWRNRLHHMWGIADVDDCISMTTYLIDNEMVDPDRVVIMGSSAGGYTALRCLISSSLFAAAISEYGVSDLEALFTGHKFESHYPISLVGNYPEDIARYRSLSPIHNLEDFDRPLLILQGRDDPIVACEQSICLAEAVRAKGSPVALIVYDSEGHGFSGSYARCDSMRAKISFLSQILSISCPDDIDALAIDNLESE